MDSIRQHVRVDGRDTMRAKQQHIHTLTLKHATLQLWHSSSGCAVAQAGAAALLCDSDRRGNGQARRHGRGEAGCHGRRETDRRAEGRDRLVWAAVLQQDVDALLASSVLSQSQRCLALSVPMAHVTAVLQTETITTPVNVGSL